MVGASRQSRTGVPSANKYRMSSAGCSRTSPRPPAISDRQNPRRVVSGERDSALGGPEGFFGGFTKLRPSALLTLLPSPEPVKWLARSLALARNRDARAGALRRATKPSVRQRP